MRKIIFSAHAFAELREWQKTDHKVVSKIFELIFDIQRQPFTGLGKPEALKHELHGWWARRITEEHRLMYRVKDDSVEIRSYWSHYGE